MDASFLLNRFQQTALVSEEKALLQIVREGDTLILQTGERVVRQTRLSVRLRGGIGLLAGLALVYFSLWGWAVSVVGLLYLLIAPRFVTSRRLLQLDTAEGKLIPLQTTGVEVRFLSLADICELHGVYETKGWDPYSVLYAQMRDGSRIPFLLLMGSSEKMAEDACRLLGNLLDCPATYTGPFGNMLSCYSPAATTRDYVTQ